MSWPAIQIANYFIKKSFEKGDPLTPMKLLKLVYIAHGWHLGYGKGPLVSEKIEAWRYGPVIPSLYQEFKKYGKENIKKEGGDAVAIDEVPNKDESTLELLDAIWEAYKGHNGLQLSTITHKSGSPWDKIWNDNLGKISLDDAIPNDIIESHYKNLIEKKPQSEAS